MTGNSEEKIDVDPQMLLILKLADMNSKIYDIFKIEEKDKIDGKF